MQNDKIGRLGKPSLIFGPGQQRRLDLIKKHLQLSGKRILDIGCGIGLYSQKFKENKAEVWGIDIDRENIQEARRLNPDINFSICPAEELPFENNFFDIVFFHEVLEHVRDDRKAILEACRVLKPGGHIIIFAPNRLYFFETHGIYIGKKYIYRLIPFINWLPRKIRDFFCPHVRVYSVKDIKKLFEGLPVEFIVIDFVYPALDKIQKRYPKIGKILRRFCDWAEKNKFFKRFGISIFAVIKLIK
jgi:ubiquinone/menaquinone biosynthesis C-methylase UbiE